MIAHPQGSVEVRGKGDLTVEGAVISDNHADKLVNPQIPEEYVEYIKRTIHGIEGVAAHPDVSYVLVTSLYRSPELNDYVGGIANSNHQTGESADFNPYDNNGQKIVDPREQRRIVAETGHFRNIVTYEDDSSKEHVHVAVKLDGQPPAPLPPTVGSDRSTPGFLDSPASVDAEELGEFGDLPDSMLKQLGVSPRDPETGEATEESVELREPPAPTEGEFDIGDIRFGSELYVTTEESGEYYRDLDDPELNQPSSVTQQNTASVGIAEMLRTDMSPVLGDNQYTPEVQVRLSVNATYRDDVNRVLRPLFAQMRRLPFVPVRNSDVARLMIGISKDYTPSDYMKDNQPELYEALSETRREEIDNGGANDLWVPCQFKSIDAVTQPGVKELYQVTLTLQYANLQPYVPQMKFWRTTEEALEWAQYLSYRSDQGATVTDVSEDSASLIMYGKHGRKTTPDLSDQVESPYKSYPFKKFYRGLLEEWQGNELFGLYRGRMEEWEDGEGLELGVAEESGESVYEPAYRMGDPTRLMEEYNPDEVMGLGYVTASNEDTRAQRMAALEAAFADRAAEIRTLKATAQKFGRSEEPGEGLAEVNPLSLGLGREWSLMVSTFGYTANELSKQINRTAQSARDAVESDRLVQRYSYELDGDEVKVVPLDADPEDNDENTLQVIPRDSVSGKVAAAWARSDGPSTPIRDPDNPNLMSSFRGEAQKLQLGIVNSYVEALFAIEEHVQEELGGATLDTAQRSADYQAATRFFDELRSGAEAIEGGPNASALGMGADTLRQEYKDPADFLMSSEVLEAIEAKEWVPQAQKDKLGEILGQTTALKEAILDQIKLDKNRRSQDYLKGRSSKRRGYLSFAESSLEKIRVSESNRFADKDWDAYAHPVPQHIGGGNSDVTIEIVTDDPILLTQISELKRSQTVLNQKRKREDVTPPLIDVYGRGCLLRSLGIRQLAYRSHTMFEAKDQPGYYKIRLELLQDESTLVRTERFDRVAGLTSANIYNTRETLPLMVPEDHGDTSTSSDDRPLSVYELTRAVYQPSSSRKSLSGGSKDQQLVDTEAYARADFLDLSEKRLSAVNVRYIDQNRGAPQGSSSSNEEAFEVEAVYSDAAGQNLPRQLYIGHILEPFSDFLDFAQGKLEPRVFDRLVAGVEGVLSSNGRSSGYINSLLQASVLPLSRIRQAHDKRAPTTLTTSGGLGRAAVPDLSRLPQENQLGDGEYFDNLTLLVERLLNDSDEDLPPLMARASLGLRQTGDQLTRLLVSTEAYREVYKEWLGWQHTPAGKSLIGSHGQDEYDWSELDVQADQLAALFEEMRSTFPTCYPDLKMPQIRDPDQGANIMGYDFPFGPGADKIEEDAAFANYDRAEEMRLVNAVQLASVGLDVVKDELEGSTQADDQSLLEKIREAEKAGDVQKVKQLEKEIANDVDATSIGTNYRAAAEKVRKRAGSEFEGAAEAAGKSLGKELSELEGLGMFSGRPLGRTHQLSQADWTRLLRISLTLQYVQRVQATAQVSGTPKFKEILGNPAEYAPEDEKGFNSAGDAEASGQARAVQDSWSIGQMEKKLAQLYSGNPQVVSEQLGYTDLTAEDDREALKQKLRSAWTQWLGMRKAFPSYAMLITGPVGSGRMNLLSDVYSWTAVQKIEIRKMAKQAGNYCDLVLSNLRNRIKMPGSRQNLELLSDEYEDLKVEVKHGTHMNVYVGYGPDIRHLSGFAGRVTDYRPGPMTAVTLSSFSTSLNNSPNQGNGFYTDGADAQRTMADVVMFTVGQTEGLEGLGRGTLAATKDALNRGSRGGELDDFKAGLAISMYQALGSPGLGTIAGENQGSVEELQKTVSRLGLSSVKELTGGSPRLYENIWLAASPTRNANAVDWVFGGLVESLINGKGWGWVSAPGESAWATLHDISKFWPDYIVTTRPYNENVGLDNLARHPLRQTLYIGPRHGKYIATSNPVNGRAQDSQKIQDQIQAILAKYTGVGPDPELAEGDESRRFSDYSDPNGDRYKRLLQAYNSLFVDATVDRLLRDRFQVAGTGALSAALEWAYETQNKIEAFWRGPSASGGEEGLQEAVSSSADLDAVIINDTEVEALYGIYSRLFPETMAALPYRRDDSMLAEKFMNQFYVPGVYFDGNEIEDTSILSDALGDYLFGVGEVLTEMFGGDNLYTLSIDTKQEAKNVLDAFERDLVNLATKADLAYNLGIHGSDPGQTHGLLDLLSEVGGESQETKSSEYRPITQHYMLSTYTNVAQNNLEATDRDPDFANKVTLSFPKDISRRIDPEAEIEYFSVQASPTLHPDFIKEKSVHFRNVEKSEQDMVGLAAGSKAGPTAVKQMGDIADWTKEVRELRNNGASLNDPEIEELEAKIQEAADTLEDTPYVKPKYQTIACNILQDRMRYMYSGEVIMGGDPRIEPYDIAHLWDDAKQMHGPTEVEDVYHYFGREGFYTVAKPKLVTSHRGIDQTLDLQYLNEASGFYHKLAGVTRYGGGFLSAATATYAAFDIAGRVAGTGALSTVTGSTAAGLGVSAGALVGASTGAAALIAGTWWMAATGGAMARQYAGYVGDITNLNPIVFVPLTEEAKPMVAGLTGATGPGSIRTAIADASEMARRDGRIPGLKAWYDRYYTPNSLGGN